jgi:uncharacterized protein DUF2281
MSTTELVELINKLPADKQKEVEEFIDSLVAGIESGDAKLPRNFGSLKGKIWISDDFDEPLKEFEDYM